MDDPHTKTQICHIDKLHDDIFYKIFYDLASDFTVIYACLLYTLANSQVCRKWRRILLDAPAIWGHVACIAVPERRKFLSKYLFSTILKRSCDAPLWVYGENDWIDYEPEARLPRHAATAEALRPLLKHLLECEGARVERISLQFEGSDVQVVMSESIYSLFQQAFNMRFFDVSLGAADGISEDKEIMLESVPFLSHFSLRGMGYELPPSTTATLRSLKLHGDVRQCSSVQDTLLLLTSLPSLEYCYLGQTLHETCGSIMGPVTLPKLLHLHVNASLPIFQTIIRSTARSSPTGCIVSFDVYGSMPETTTAMDFTSNFFLPLVQANINICCAPLDTYQWAEVQLVLNDNIVSISWSSTSRTNKVVLMSVTDMGPGYSFLCELLSRAIQNIGTCFFRVQTLFLTLGRALSPVQLATLAIFRSVVHLALRYLDDFPGKLLAYMTTQHGDESYPLVPEFTKLRKISYFGPLTACTSAWDKQERVARNLVTFLTYRKEMGLPLHAIETIGSDTLPVDISRVLSPLKLEVSRTSRKGFVQDS